MLLKQKVKIKWNGNNRKYYESLGYKWTKANDEFSINVDELMKGSKVHVKLICDYCKEKILTREYREVIKNIKHCCNKCIGKKIIENKIKKGNSLANKYPNLIKYWSNKNKELPSNVSYGSNKKFWFKCKYGHEFLSKLPEKGKFRCKYCNSISEGERLVSNILNKKKIKFKQQYSFPDLLSENDNPLKFDFAIFYKDNLHYLIEYDGEQHYKSIYGEDNLEITKYRDNLKNIYCKNNNIKLIRIPFWEFDNIETIINSIM